jgi:hypothetical protein
MASPLVVSTPMSGPTKLDLEEAGATTIDNNSESATTILRQERPAGAVIEVIMAGPMPISTAFSRHAMFVSYCPSGWLIAPPGCVREPVRVRRSMPSW